MLITAGNGKKTFKNLVLSIIRARRWKISLIDGKDGLSSEELPVNSWYEDNDTLHFNINAFKPGNSGTGLSKRATFALMKNAWERTDEELELLHGIVDQMKSFEKCSPLVKRELARVMHFETFEDGRVILREGHQGFSMYFIVKGGVAVQVTQDDSRTGERRTQTVGEISAGSCFGELALIQDCTRTATIICKGTSQFLRVDKPDFDLVLRRSYEKEWKDRLDIIEAIPFFKGCSEFQKRHINLNSKVEEFASDKIILPRSFEEDESEPVHFVVSGICKIIKKIDVVVTPDCRGKTMLALVNPSRECQALSLNQEIQTRFLNIGALEPGDYFGAGEDMTDTFIMAFGRVECLLLPRQVIVSLERLDTSSSEMKNVGTIADMLNHTRARMLTQKEAFDLWMVHVGWKNYKKKLLGEIVGDKSGRFRRRKFEPNVIHEQHGKFSHNANQDRPFYKPWK